MEGEEEGVWEVGGKGGAEENGEHQDWEGCGHA